MEKQTQIIKSLIETILEKLTVSGEVELLLSDEYPQFIIRTREAGLLIGENGQSLFALNLLLKKVIENELRKNDLEIIPFFLDVNDYQAKKIEELKNMAKMCAQRVRFFKKEITLEPMNAYERRIVHAALTEYPDITTESMGEDPNRCVVVKPYEI